MNNVRVAPTPGERFGPYDIIGPLGAGGMGLVFRARDTRLGREVALKTLPPESIADPARLQRFEQEARAASALNHPNVLAVFDVGSEGGTPFLVTELLEGETLRDRIKKGPIPPRKVIELAMQVAHGLAAVHEKGIVHRDLKPDNLFITRDGQVKILDFGVARTAESSTPPTGTLPLTQSGAVMGTAGYMAPEQVRGRVADARSDIFALGVIIYECLSGHMAFPGETPVERGYAILNSDPADLSTHKVHAPPSLVRIMRRCLEKSPEQRFQHARDLVFALEAVNETTGPSPIVVATKPRVRLVAVLWVAVVLLFIALVLMWRSRDRAQEIAREGAVVPTVRRVSFRNGSIYNARFTPDGRGLVYAAKFEEDPPRTYVGVIDTAELRPVSAPGTTLFDVSAKDEIVTGGAPSSRRVPGYALSKSSLNGSASRPLYQSVNSADFGPDGELLLTRHLEDEGFTIEAPPGNRLITSSDPLVTARFSPNGKFIAFQRQPVRGDDRGWIEIIDRSGTLIVKSKQAWTLEGLAWAPDSREVWFTAGYDSVSRQIFAVNLSGKERRVYGGTNSLRIHDIDARGRVLVSSGLTRSRMFGRLGSELRERSLSWLDGSMPIDLANDGTAMLFLEGYGPGGTEVQTWFRPLGGKDETPWMVSLGWGRALSPDKQWAVVSPTPPFGTLRVVPIGPGEPRDLPGANFKVIGNVRYFADGKRIAFSAIGDDNKQRLYVQSVLPKTDELDDDDQPVLVSDTPLFLNAPPSPDGQTLAGLTREKRPVLIDVESGDISELPGLQIGDHPIQWTVNGKGLWIARSGEPMMSISTQLFRYEISTGKLIGKGFIEPPDLVGMSGVKEGIVAPDGEQYVYTVHQELDELFLLEGVR